MKSWRTVLAFALPLSLTASARAQVATTPDEALTNTAKDLFAKGAQALKEEKWAECRASLIATMSLGRKPSKVAGNLGYCEEKLRLYRDAAEHLAIFLAAPLDSPPEGVRHAQASFASATSKVTTAKVRVDVAGAEILVDDKLVGEAPLAFPLFLEPGPHQIVARKVGFTIARRALDAQAGATVDVALTLAPSSGIVPIGPSEARPKWPVVVTGVLALGGIAAGGVLVGAANSKASDAANVRAGLHGSEGETTVACSTLADDLNSQSSLARGAVAGFALGGAFAAATVGLAVWSFGGSSEVQVSPTVGGLVVKKVWR